MTLSKILDGVTVIKMFQTMYGKMVATHDVEVNGVQYDSRKLQRGEMFVAIRGATADGHTFIDKAVANGATVVVVEDDTALPDSYFMHAGVVKIVVADSRKALARMSANYYEHPSLKLKLIGVTGTNGKTTTTFLVKSILEANGDKVGLIGTIEYKIGDDVIPATHTTPESLELNELLATLVRKGCTAAVMEVSSHALAQHRVYGLNFAAAAFTNLTQDHLDYHHTMDEYFRAKKILFDGLNSHASVATNVDDEYGVKIFSDTTARALTFGISRGDVLADDIHLTMTATNFRVNYRNTRCYVSSTLIGRFNVENILAAFTTAVGLRIEPNTIVEGIASLKSVHGRFEQILSPSGWVAIVDYAHTHDGMENCLRAIHESFPKERRGRIICVFGAGGNRDKTKRPKMGRVAAELSDIVVLTSDNPRFEHAEEIVKDIQAGIPAGTNVHVEVDRRKAIRLALGMARRDDVVLIAGKGHETYQVFGAERVPFDDREEVEKYIRDTA
jgi:UDP-N-acetylmuramoyl-L-alanyl-D-glutamate--2,6-diaminopimelate ligase